MAEGAGGEGEACGEGAGGSGPAVGPQRATGERATHQARNSSSSATVAAKVQPALADYGAGGEDVPQEATAGGSRRSQAATTHTNAVVNVGSALVSGALVAVLFHPWDRALYLSVLRGSHFLAWNNFQRPFHGFAQTAIHRTVSTGSYFPLYDAFYAPVQAIVGASTAVSPRHREPFTSFLVGNMAGACNGLAFNWLTAIKYHAWKGDLSFEEARARMWRKGQIRPFMNGVCATVARDSVFGGVYAMLKVVFCGWLQGDDAEVSRRGRLTAGIVAGTVATVVSAPWNYARNVKYATEPHHAPPGSYGAIRDLIREARATGSPGTHLQQKLRLGWGTARVGVGFAVAHEVYERVRDVFETLR